MHWRARGAFLQVLALAILVGIMSQLWSDRTPISIGDDSLQYHQIATALRTRTYFTQRPPADLPIGFVVRTPGFPIILALGEALAPDHPRRSVLIPHTLLLLLLVAFLHTKAGGNLHPLISVLGIVFALPQMRRSFGHVATEWSAFVFSIALIGAACRTLRSRRHATLILVAFLVAVAILIKPTLVFLLALPAALPLLTKQRVRAFLNAALGLLPLWTWLGFNYWRFDRVTLAPIAGYGLIFTGALLGGAEADHFAAPATREFARQFNTQRPQFDEGEIAAFNRNPRLRPEEMQNKYRALILAAFDAGDRLGVDYIEFNEILRTYSIQAIRLHPRRYIHHVVSALGNVSVPILMLLAVICAHSRLRGYDNDNEILAYSMLTTYFHLGLLLVTAVVQPIDPRYYALCVAVPYFYTVVIVCLYGRAILGFGTLDDDRCSGVPRSPMDVALEEKS